MLGDLASFQQRLLDWYAVHRRDLPWRIARDAPAGARPDPYRVLVSEAMLQQTQVATVVPYFNRFLAALPTVEALANAPEDDVLRLWQGLGYYRRARNLQAAARAIVERHGGRVPSTVAELRALPGVGPYTAGAIASLAHEVRAPILDGNVVRVLCRLDFVDDDPRKPSVQKQLWKRAEDVLPTARVGDFNSALMELGATVCVPGDGPACLVCPVRAHCEAQAAGAQGRVPMPKKAKATLLEERVTLVVRRADGALLVEQRPATGRWAGLWQFPTRPLDTCRAAVPTGARPLGEVAHGLTHRRYRFEAFLHDGDVPPAFARDGQRWATRDELDKLAFGKPQLAILKRV